MLQIKINRARDELPKETIKAIDSVDWKAYILSLREKKGYSFEQLEDLELETELLLCGLLRPEDYPKELEERMKIPKPQVDLLVSEMNEFVFKKIKEELIRNTEKKEIFIKTTDGNNDQLRITNYELKDKESVKNEQPPITNYESKEKQAPVLSKNTEIEIAPAEISAPIQKSELISKNESNILQKAGIEINSGENILKTESKTPVSNILNTDQNEKNPTRNIGDNTIKKLVEREESIDKELANQKIMKSISAQKLSGSFQMPSKTTQYSLDNISKQEKKETKNSLGYSLSKSDPYRIDPNE